MNLRDFVRQGVETHYRADPAKLESAQAEFLARATAETKPAVRPTSWFLIFGAAAAAVAAGLVLWLNSRPNAAPPPRDANHSAAEEEEPGVSYTLNGETLHDIREVIVEADVVTWIHTANEKLKSFHAVFFRSDEQIRLLLKTFPNRLESMGGIAGAIPPVDCRIIFKSGAKEKILALNSVTTGFSGANEHAYATSKSFHEMLQLLVWRDLHNGKKQPLTFAGVSIAGITTIDFDDETNHVRILVTGDDPRFAPILDEIATAPSTAADGGAPCNCGGGQYYLTLWDKQGNGLPRILLGNPHCFYDQDMKERRLATPGLLLALENITEQELEKQRKPLVPFEVETILVTRTSGKPVSHEMTNTEQKKAVLKFLESSRRSSPCACKAIARVTLKGKDLNTIELMISDHCIHSDDHYHECPPDFYKLIDEFLISTEKNTLASFSIGKNTLSEVTSITVGTTLDEPGTAEVTDHLQIRKILGYLRSLKKRNRGPCKNTEWLVLKGPDQEKEIRFSLCEFCIDHAGGDCYEGSREFYGWITELLKTDKK